VRLRPPRFQYSCLVEPEQPDPSVQVSSGGTGLAVAGLICGLAGLLFLPIILGPLAIIFGGIGLSNAAKNPIGHGKSMATAALVLGIIDVCFVVLAFVRLASR
jgi:hypothetical protein